MAVNIRTILFPVVAAFAGLVAVAAPEKPRIIVLTDITNEPDDEQSMVRFLCYANQFQIEGLIATTSCWLRDRTAPERILERIEAYGEVRPNLLVHANDWPGPDELAGVVRSGLPEFGMAGVGEGKDSPGSRHIIDVVDREDARPVNVSIWGGANCLAQALWTVRATRSPEDLNGFVDKLRVYAISDQDDSGPWIRETFPDLFYIVSPGYEENGGGGYHDGTWVGISGDKFHGNFSGPDFALVDNPWLDANIRHDHGPLGALYPRTVYLMEGDTPSFLWLIANGLGDPAHPDYGGWGGRYELYIPETKPWFHQPETRPIWTNATDRVRGIDGEWRESNHATIWRWREAFQHDFAARIDWSVASDFTAANHNPVAVLNGDESRQIIRIAAEPGVPVQLSAAGSKDPDGDELSVRWFVYPEAGTFEGEVELSVDSDGKASFIAPAVTEPRTIHVILELRDDGSPELFAYRRAVVEVQPGGT